MEEKEKDKQKEIAATNKLLNIIRGEEKKENTQPTPQPIFNNSADIKKETKSLSNKKLSKNEYPDFKRQKTPSANEVPFLDLTKNKRKNGLGFLKHLLSRGEKKSLGIDIGTHSLKYVLMGKSIGGLRVLDYKIVELPFETLDDNGKSIANTLKSMLKGLKLDDVTIISSVSGPSVIVRHVQFPPMSEKELIQSLNWEAKSYIPFPLNEINLDYQILPQKGKDQRLDVILVAVTKKTLKTHLDILERVPIKPNVVDIDSLVLINTYLLSREEIDDKTMALINIGAQSTVLSIYRTGSLFFTREIHIGGNSFTKQIQSQLKVSFDEAESIKKNRANYDDLSSNEGNLAKIIAPLLNELISEVRRTLIYYDNQTGKKGFGDIILTGGGALLDRLSEKFASDLGLSVKFLDPFRRIKLEDANHPTLLMKEQSERLALSFGLALRGLL